MKKYLGTIVLLIVGASVGLYSYYTYRMAHNIDFDTLELTNLAGESIDIQSIASKHLFIHFFATWCGNCLNEQAALESGAEILKEDQVTTLLISDEPIEKLKQFVLNKNLNTPIYHSKKKLSDLTIYTIPTCYLIHKNGEVVFTHVGEEAWDSPNVLKKLRAALN